MSAAALQVRAVVAPPLQPAAGPSGMSATSALWLPADDWPAAQDAWRGLAGAALPNAFLAPGFALAARAIDAAPGLGAIVIQRDGHWIGFVPGRFGLAGAVFSGWIHDYAPYGLPLVRPGQEVAVAAGLVGFLRERGATALDLAFLDDGPFAEALAAVWAGHRTTNLDRHQRACLVEVPPPLSKEHRRLARRLAEHGVLDQVSTATGHPVATAIEAFLALEAAGWKGRRGTALAARPATRGFFAGAVALMAPEGQARIDILRLDGRPIAAGVSFVAGDRAWYLKTAYDERFAKFSPGLLLSQAIGQTLMADGRVRLVDSCAVAGHSMIDRIWPGRMTMTRSLLAVSPGDPGWRYGAALWLKRGAIGARAAARRLRARLAKR